MLSLLGGKLALYAGAAVVVLGLGWLALHERDAARAAQAAAEAKDLQIASITSQAAAQVSALEQAATVMQTRLALSANIRSAIHDAPKSSTCAGSPAVRAALAGLRDRNARPGAAPGGAPVPAVVPPGAKPADHP